MTRSVLGLIHGADDAAELVLICYLLGVEALRAGKEALMWLTKDGVHVATDGFAQTVSVPTWPSIAELHTEYVERGGRFFACPVCVKNPRDSKGRRGHRTPRSRGRRRSTSSPQAAHSRSTTRSETPAHPSGG